MNDVCLQAKTMENGALIYEGVSKSSCTNAINF